MPIDVVEVPEDQRWRYRAAAARLRQAYLGRPLSPAAQLLLNALDDLAAGRPPRIAEPAAEPAHASRILAIGLGIAGISLAALVAALAIGAME